MPNILTFQTITLRLISFLCCSVKLYKHSSISRKFTFQIFLKSDQTHKEFSASARSPAEIAAAIVIFNKLNCQFFYKNYLIFLLRLDYIFTICLIVFSISELLPKLVVEGFSIRDFLADCFKYSFFSIHTYLYFKIML